MNLEFDASFLKFIKKNKDASLAAKIERVLLECEKANEVAHIPDCKKLAGFSTFYRIRIGDYRLGFERISDTTIRFVALAHRKEIYKRFP